MKYSHLLPSLTASIFFLPIISCELFVAACVWYWQALREMWVFVSDIGGITQTSIPLDSSLMPSDASHLRHRHWRPSKPSAHLANWFVLGWNYLWVFQGEYVLGRILCTWMWSIFKKGLGLGAELALCHELLVCFPRASKSIKPLLSFRLQYFLPSSRFLTKPALFRL